MKAFLKKIKDKKDAKKGKKMIFDVAGDISSKYEIKEVLGKGTFSVVRLGVNLETGEHVAIKVINKNDIDVKVNNLKTEVDILMQVKHPYIVNLLDVFEDDHNVFLVMDLMMGGEMFDRICKDYPMGYSEKTSSEIVKKILEAVDYLHSKGVIHRDLKPENLLYARPDDDSDVKLSDFGLAKIYKGDIVVKTACGSPNYVAPEVLIDLQEGYNFSVDMWSIGVIIYVLLCGFCPFFADNTSALFKLITTGSYNFPSPYWDHISDSAKDLIRHLLDVNVKTRYTARQALEHQWIKENTSEAPIPHINKYWEEHKNCRGKKDED